MQTRRHRQQQSLSSTASCSLSPLWRNFTIYNVILSRSYWRPAVSALMPSFVRVSWQFPWRWNNCGQPLSLIMSLTPGPSRFHQPSEQEVRSVSWDSMPYNHCPHISRTSCVPGSRFKSSDYLFAENVGFDCWLNNNKKGKISHLYACIL